MTNQEQGYEARFHFLSPGCLGPYLDRFAAELALAGYTTLSVSNYQQSVAHFGTWLERKRIAIGDIDEAVVAAFADHRCRCPGGRRYKKLSRRYVARVQRFVHYLSQQGLVDVAQKRAKDVHPASVVEFSHWMHRHRGVSPRTIERYVRCIVSLLPILGHDPALYDAAVVRQAIEHEAARHTRATAQGFAIALRAYLRFLAAQGRCRATLSRTISSV